MATRPLPRQSAPPRLRVVRGRASRPRRARPRGAVLFVILAVVTVFAVAAMQAYVGQDGLKVADLERNVQRESERLTLLRAKAAQLESPRRLVDEANELGLVADPDPVFLRAPARSSSDAPSVTP